MFELPPSLDPLPILAEIPPGSATKTQSQAEGDQVPDRGRARPPVLGHPLGARPRHLPDRLPGRPACVRSRTPADAGLRSQGRQDVSIWIRHYCVTDVKAAATFYQKAFGFQKRGIMNGPGGKPIHAELT